MRKEKEIQVDENELILAVGRIMAFCQSNGMSELVAYMAMISITKTMEEKLGFGLYERKKDS